MWAPARWVLSVFEVAVFSLAGFSILRRVFRGGSIAVHPVGLLLGMTVVWGAIQIAAHRTVYELKTWEAMLGWTINLAAVSLALEYCGDIERRERFLRVISIFAF